MSSLKCQASRVGDILGKIIVSGFKIGIVSNCAYFTFIHRLLTERFAAMYKEE